MRVPPRHRSLITWMNILVMLVVALAPTLTHALERWSSTPPPDVCGSVLHEASPARWATELPAPDAPGSERCALCCTAFFVPALPPVLPAARIEVDAQALPCWDSPQPLPRPQRLGQDAQPRAPPGGEPRTHRC